MSRWIILWIIAIYFNISSCYLFVYKDGFVASTYNITRLFNNDFNNISGVLNHQILILNNGDFISEQPVVEAVILENIPPAYLYMFGESFLSSPSFTVSDNDWDTLANLSDVYVVITEDGTYDPNYDTSKFPSVLAAMIVTVIMVFIMLMYCIFILGKLIYQRGCKKQYIVSYVVLTNQIILNSVQFVLNFLLDYSLFSFRMNVYLTEYFILTHTSSIFLLYFFWLMVLKNKKLIISTSHFKILYRISIIVCAISQIIALSLLVVTLIFGHPSSVWTILIPYVVILSLFVTLSTFGSVYVVYNIYHARHEFLFLKKPLLRYQRLFIVHCGISVIVAVYSLVFAFSLPIIQQIPVLVWLTKLNILLNIAWSFSTVSVAVPKIPKKDTMENKKPKVKSVEPVYTLKRKENNPQNI